MKGFTEKTAFEYPEIDSITPEKLTSVKTSKAMRIDKIPAPIIANSYN